MHLAVSSFTFSLSCAELAVITPFDDGDSASIASHNVSVIIYAYVMLLLPMPGDIAIHCLLVHLVVGMFVR